MGVTLERVQNKFACIIGELCSEPVVLSQFAIWLDLRLAEYKAKGAISLDCSGDNPEPVWLNGHRLQPKTSNLLGRFDGMSPQNTQPGPGEMSWSRISAERSSNQSPTYDTMVKQEPLEQEDVGVFPISLHPHEMSEPRTPNRKRNAAETISSEQELLSSAKSRRLTPPHHSSTSATDPTSNQSLMSIISTEMPESQTHDTVETVDLTDSDMNIIMSYEDKHATPSRGENSRASFTSQNSMTPGGDVSSRADDSINTDVDQGEIITIVEDLEYLEEGEVSLSRVKELTVPDTCELESNTPTEIRKRIPKRAEKSRNLMNALIGSIRVIGSWLWLHDRESRLIEDIPPRELNKFLTEFFTFGKTLSGLEYTGQRLSCVRSNLERFLKEKGYPSSISRSDTFKSSREALLKRYKNDLGSNLPKKRGRPPLRKALFKRRKDYKTNPVQAGHSLILSKKRGRPPIRQALFKRYKDDKTNPDQADLGLNLPKKRGRPPLRIALLKRTTDDKTIPEQADLSLNLPKKRGRPPLKKLLLKRHKDDKTNPDQADRIWNFPKKRGRPPLRKALLKRNKEDKTIPEQADLSLNLRKKRGRPPLKKLLLKRRKVDKTKPHQEDPDLHTIEALLNLCTHDSSNPQPENMDLHTTDPRSTEALLNLCTHDSSNPQQENLDLHTTGPTSTEANLNLYKDNSSNPQQKNLYLHTTGPTNTEALLNLCTHDRSKPQQDNLHLHTAGPTSTVALFNLYKDNSSNPQQENLELHTMGPRSWHYPAPYSHAESSSSFSHGDLVQEPTIIQID